MCDSVKKTRQAGRVEYRGRELPEGMTPAIAEELASLIADYERGEFDGLLPDAAIRAFVISRSLQG